MVPWWKNDGEHKRRKRSMPELHHGQKVTPRGKPIWPGWCDSTGTQEMTWAYSLNAGWAPSQARSSCAVYSRNRRQHSPGYSFPPIYPSKIYNICVIVQDRKKWKRLLLSTLNSAQTNTLISEPSRPLPTDQIVGSSYSHKLDNSNHNYPHYYYPINHPDTGHHHALPPQYTRYSTQTTTTTDNLQVKRRRNQPPGGHVRSPKHT